MYSVCTDFDSSSYIGHLLKFSKVQVSVLPWYLFAHFNPLKVKLVQILFKNSVCTSKKTHVFITKISWSMLFKKINHCLLKESYEIHNHILRANCRLTDY
jgi:hypothetical protein